MRSAVLLGGFFWRGHVSATTLMSLQEGAFALTEPASSLKPPKILLRRAEPYPWSGRLRT